MSYEITKWLTNIAETEFPPPSLIAFNIGLFEGEDGYTAYLIGSKEYGPDDSDWACGEDFIPKEKYFKLKCSAGKEWQVIESEVASEMKAFLLSDAAARSFFAGAKAITVGFDDGDLVKVNA